MGIFDELSRKDHEQVVFCRDEVTGLKAIIAIHDTTLGPALGGTRMWSYANEEDALRDVLRLSRGMTYKSAAAGLNLGGGKAVIIGDAKTMKNEMLFRAYGRFIQGLNGRYITAEDVGTTVRDMEWVRMVTDSVVGISRALGGSGDPSPVTAFGTYEGIKASLKWHTGNESLAGRTVAIQGVGAVGYHLVSHVAKAGAKVVIADIDHDNLKRVTDEFSGIEVVSPDRIYGVACDVFAPCALGGAINLDTLPRIRARVIAGAANNQLADAAAGRDLFQRGILYAPDYVINGGGIINVAGEIRALDRGEAFDPAWVDAKLDHLALTLEEVLDQALHERRPTNEVANQIARSRISGEASSKAAA